MIDPVDDNVHRESGTRLQFAVLLGSFLLVPAAVLLINLLVDPLMVLHKPWYSRPLYYSDERYMTPGWVKVHRPSTVVVGPSTTQAFQSDLLEAAGIVDAQNVSVAAATLHEQRLLVERVLATGRLQRVIWGVEWVTVAWPSHQVTDRFGPFPHFLYDRPIEIGSRYLLNTQIAAISVRLMLKRFYDRKAVEFDSNPEATKVSSTGREYGIAAAVRDYFAVLKSTEVEMSLNGRSSRDMFEKNLKLNLLDPVRLNPYVQFDVFLPPNSILQLSLLERNFPSQWRNFLFLRQALAKLAERPNVRVYDFYNTTKYYSDLKRYGDIQHFDRGTAAELLSDINAGRSRINLPPDDVPLLANVKNFQRACPDVSLLGFIQPSYESDAGVTSCEAVLKDIAGR